MLDGVLRATSLRGYGLEEDIEILDIVAGHSTALFRASPPAIDF